jgi:DNA-binding CsgD family transcriptional regulator/tetratricopeptide (TPR) repeat protein
MLWRYARECNVLERQEEAITAIRKALDLWIEQGDSLKQGEILAFLTIMLRNHGDTQEAEQTSRAAIDLLESLPPSRELAHAYRVQATLRLASRNVDEALEWAERAVVLAERFEAGNILATAHVAIGSALLFLDYERGCAYLEQQLEFGRKTWHERYVANLLTYLGSCSVEVYHLHRAVDYLAEGIAYASERGLDRFNRAMQAWLALAYLHLGRWGEADELVSLIARGPTGSVLNRIPTLVAVGLLRARRGDPGSESALNEALELAGPTGSLSLLGPVRAARAEATWLAGDRQGAFEEAQAVYGLAVSKRHPWITGELALWCWKAGGVVEVPDWVAKPYALHVAGDWRAAADEWERLGCPFWRASALADGGREAQIAALKIFEHLGARPNADMLRGKLRAAGAAGIPRQPRSSTRLNPFGLTNRQAEILALLIEQLTNADIAARLHISPKTVDHHVSAILSGLNVRTRQEAANVARQNPRFTLQK